MLMAACKDNASEQNVEIAIPPRKALALSKDERERLWKEIFFDENERKRLWNECTDQTPALQKDEYYHLRMELLFDEDEVTEEQKKEILRLLKAEKGFSREYLIRSGASLKNLHYAIQGMFGWQNRSAHFFSISDEEFNKLTAQRWGGYRDLRGDFFVNPIKDRCLALMPQRMRHEEAIDIGFDHRRVLAHMTMIQAIICWILGCCFENGWRSILSSEILCRLRKRVL